MPAFAYEYELTKSDGIAWEFLASPVKIVGDASGVTGVEFVRNRSVGTGRTAKLEPISGSNFNLPADMVIKALGQEPLLDLFRALPNLKVDKGRVVVDRNTGATSVRKLFAGGDCTSKGAEVVDAVQEGKLAAAGIHALLS
jgi:NADPH-dependent glutamate synthase beta subunit-like oxidoreductase